MTTGANYFRVVASPAWAELRRLAADRAGGRCEGLVLLFDRAGRAVRVWTEYRKERCGATHGLQLHHLHYATVGAETLADVQLLCDRCHQVATVLGVTCSRCGDPVCGDEADAWRFVSDAAATRLLAVTPPKIIELARDCFGSWCEPCKQTGGLDWSAD